MKGEGFDSIQSWKRGLVKGTDKGRAIYLGTAQEHE
jgi:hypothetical protein